MNGWTWPRWVDLKPDGKPPASPPIFRQNSLLLLACFIFAVILWAYVAGLEPDTSTRMSKGEISATIHFLHPHLTIVQPDTQTATIQLQGPASGIDHAVVIASVDLNSITTPGQYTLPVNVQTFDPDLTATVIPDHVSVFLDDDKTRTLPLAPHLKGQSPPGYVAGTAVLDPDSVSITGPSTLIADAHPTVDFDLKGVSHSVYVMLSVHLPGVPDSQLSLFKVDPSEVGLYLPIERRLSYATLPISPQVTTLPPPGFQLRRVQVMPPTITASGPREVLDDLDTIPTSPISLEGATKSFVTLVDLAPPPKVHVEGSQAVRVQFDIEPAPPSAASSTRPAQLAPVRTPDLEPIAPPPNADTREHPLVSPQESTPGAGDLPGATTGGTTP